MEMVGWVSGLRKRASCRRICCAFPLCGCFLFSFSPGGNLFKRWHFVYKSSNHWEIEVHYWLVLRAILLISCLTLCCTPFSYLTWLLFLEGMPFLCCSRCYYSSCSYSNYNDMSESRECTCICFVGKDVIQAYHAIFCINVFEAFTMRRFDFDALSSILHRAKISQ